jgi:hypothetical protein
MKWMPTNGLVIQPVLDEISTTSPCPRKALIGKHKFPAINDPAEYTFTARAVNWLGGTTSSPKVTMNTH